MSNRIRFDDLIVLDRIADGEQSLAYPPAWQLSEIAEAFSLPLVTGGAMDQPLHLARHIMSLRAYWRARGLLDGAERRSDVPNWAVSVVDLVKVERLKRSTGR